MIEKKQLPNIEENSIIGFDESYELATKESISLNEGDLEKEAKRSEHKRRENFREQINKAAKIIFWIGVLGIIVLIFTEIWHLVTPTCWHYLEKDQLSKIETILFSGMIAAMVSEYTKKYI